MRKQIPIRWGRTGTVLAALVTLSCASLTTGDLNAQQLRKAEGLQLRKLEVQRRLSKEDALTRELNAALKLMGHRNWIVIADSAYPEQARAGIKTVASGMSQLEVVKQALQAVEKAPHVRGIIYLDEELKFVSPDDAPGITKYQTELDKLLKGKTIQTQLHEDTIAALDEAAETFRVLIIKTDMILPYTSVFIQLDCGYWSADAEERMRAKMEKK